MRLMCSECNGLILETNYEAIAKLLTEGFKCPHCGKRKPEQPYIRIKSSENGGVVAIEWRGFQSVGFRGEWEYLVPETPT